MPRYAPAMLQDDLHRLVIDLAIEHDCEGNGTSPQDTHAYLGMFVYELQDEDCFAKVIEDWSKVDFNRENLDVDGTYSTTGGIPYLACSGGGDWETPVFAIIYFDGKHLRGFVPKNGNSYNHKTKTAFGNDEKSDWQAAVDQFGVTGNPATDTLRVEANLPLVIAEVEKRLVAKGHFTYAPRTVVSPTDQKKARQIAIEATMDLSGPITPDMVYAVISLAAGASYINFELRASRRTLLWKEVGRMVGLPRSLVVWTTKDPDDEATLYTQDGCYPIQAQALLERAGFTKAPDNDISMYAQARTVYVVL